ncbi:zinc finger protein [Saccharopolyspora pogona]|uniref:zinc finger protein n=1 Tax=Saccharopolyspora pogona TaxID=333966 RepID=UPI0016822EAF|nr:zinc finger protein [Saccharopolyspora pogona]
MHPFDWVPAEGERHASLDSRPGGGYPTGMAVLTLCRKQLSADNSQLGWLWSTCRDCSAEAHRIAASQASVVPGERNFRAIERGECSVRFNTSQPKPPRSGR